MGHVNPDSPETPPFGVSLFWFSRVSVLQNFVYDVSQGNVFLGGRELTLQLI